MKNILQKLIFKLTVIVLCASFIYSNYLYIKINDLNVYVKMILGLI